MIRIATLVTVLLLASPAFAQVETVLGQRVRLTYRLAQEPISRQVIGVFTTATSDSLTVNDSYRVVEVSRASVERLQVYAGQRSRAGRGALIGLASGALFLGGLGAATTDGQCEAGTFICFEPSPGEAFAFGAIVGGLLGAGIGGLVGVAIKVDRWEPVPLNASVSMAPSGLSVRLRL